MTIILIALLYISPSNPVYNIIIFGTILTYITIFTDLVIYVPRFVRLKQTYHDIEEDTIVFSTGTSDGGGSDTETVRKLRQELTDLKGELKKAKIAKTSSQADLSMDATIIASPSGGPNTRPSVGRVDTMELAPPSRSGGGSMPGLIGATEEEEKDGAGKLSGDPSAPSRAEREMKRLLLHKENVIAKMKARLLELGEDDVEFDSNSPLYNPDKHKK